MISRLRILLGLDRAIAYSVAGTVRSVLGGPLVAVVIALRFSPEIQGYYYTFGSILALQVFAELGLGAVIVQFVAHEWAHLDRDAAGRVVGDSLHLSRLASIVRFSLKWYAAAALLLGAGLLVGGNWFFSSRVSSVNWFLPWLMVVFLACLRFALSPVFSILEGCGQLASVYGYRLWEGTQMVLVICLLAILGAELWTIVVFQASALVAATIFVWRSHGPLLTSLFTVPAGSRVSWKDELFPLQWKFALSWMTGYFIFQLFVPVAFNYHGPELAGRIGMTLSLVNVIGAMSSAWISTKIPTFGSLVARERWAELDSVVWRAAVTATAIAALGAAGVVVGLRILDTVAPSLGDRFLDPSSALPFLAATVLVQITGAQAAYLRAFKQEPFLWPSVVGGLLVGCLTWILGAKFGALGMGLGYLAVMSVFTLPVFTLIFLKLRSEWQTAAPARLHTQGI